MEPTLLTILWLGLLLGMEHALDADHVIAVSTIVSEHRTLRRASLVGIFWGLGHTVTLLLVGLAVILFKVTIPEPLARSMEFAVGIVLVALGVLVVRGYVVGKVHAHTHRHGDGVHLHFHAHAAGEHHDHAHPVSRHRRSLLVGAIHGLAGGTTVMLLVLATIPTLALGFLGILVFGAGSILGMLGVSTLLGLPFVMTSRRFVGVHRTIRIGAGTVSMAYGLWIMVYAGMSRSLR